MERFSASQSAVSCYTLDKGAFCGTPFSYPKYKKASGVIATAEAEFCMLGTSIV
mgnify:CR=1 FL=1